jgi:amino acid adenylation domain-containing protein/non-ribosomal peptide synthase protein (TIGR01720 family)/FkbM family methyltransferase
MQNATLEGFRLSPQQERLWSLQQAGGGDAPFRALCVVRVEGPLRPDVLADAVAAVVRRHEILRTGFQRLPGMSLPVQVISDEGAARFETRDLAGLGAGEQEAEVAALVAEAGRERLDLETPSLPRVRLARLGDDRHALVISLPALCADRAGLDNLVGELGRAYENRLRGTEEADEPLQYADLSEWQNELLEAEETGAGREYWRRRDYSSTPEARLPFERAADEGGPFNPEVVASHLDAGTASKLASLASRYGTTVPVCLLACWQTLLWRLTGQPEIVVGVAHDCRTYEGLGEALGLFVRHLPVYAHVEGHTPFAEVLRRTADESRDAGRWQEYFTFTESGANARRFLPFAFEYAAPAPVRRAADLVFRTLRRHACAERFRLKLVCSEGDGGALSIEAHYDAAAYERFEVELLTARLAALAAAAAEAPETEAGRLCVVGAGERRLLLEEWNRTEADYGGDRCLHELFEQQAARTPDSTALVFGDQSLTYSELNERANRLARHLRTLGVGADSLVGVLMERSAEMVVSLLGVLKAGGAYLPLDPEYPHERLSFMLSDAGVSVLLTQEQLRERVPAEVARVVYLDAEWGEVAKQGGGDLTGEGVAAAPENLAYVIYTSGSTGTPKGVMIPHRGIVNRVLWMHHASLVMPDDRVLFKTAFSFDASVWEIFAPLLAGARSVVARPGGQQDTAYLVEAIKEYGVTVLQLVPTMLQVLLDEPGLEGCRSLRKVFCGGEALGTELRKRFFARSGAELHNLYGPTEVSIDATHHACVRDDAAGVVPIGRPLGNVRVYILDEHMQPAPLGVAGELHVGGAGLARGYLERPGLTAEKFVPDPFSAEPGARLYRTGDLARHLPGGEIEYVGRIDHQVKLRGFRVELGEIESVLSSHPAVRESVVVAREDEPGHKRLVAYVVTEKERAPRDADGALHRLPGGLEVAHLNRNETEVIYKEIFEDLTYLRHGVTLKDGDCVFDVGANIGMFSLFVHHVCRDARVFAFEPCPPTFAKLRANVELHGLPVNAFDCGLSDKAGSATVTFYPKMSSMSGLYADAAEDADITRAFLGNQSEGLSQYADELLEGRFEAERYECGLRTVSGVMREQGIERIDLLKVDVEKSELDVLLGIEEQDWRKIRQVVVEAQDGEGRLGRIVGLLESHGFGVVVEQDALLKNTAIYNVYATRPGEGGEEVSADEWRERLERGARSLAARGGSAAELRGYMKERLPEYMVPVAFVMLRSLPTAPNGKLDRRALPAPDPSHLGDEESFVAPHTPLEETLAAIWSQVLGVGRVGVRDNFFSLGGDSILSIQIIARANQSGVRLTPAQLFANQTIAELAAVAGTARAAAAEQGAVTGALPLTPAQHWFFEQEVPDRHHWNQAVMFEPRRRLDPSLLEMAVRRLFEHHDALRLRFVREGEDWRQFLAAPGDGQPPFSAFDLSGLAEDAQGRAVEEEAAKLQAGLDLADGPVALVAHFNLGPGRPGRLLFVAHHLVVDGVSWRVLLEDFQTAYGQLEEGGDVRLPEKTISFKQWSERLAEYARSERLREELPFWEDERRAGARHLPVDFEGGANTRESARTVTVSLDAAETEALLHKLPEVFNTQINEVLLAAVAQAFARWTGERSLLVASEGHGREHISDDLDLSRTVGWFTTLFPVFLDLGDGREPGAELQAVKEQLRGVPNRGLGYGVLKYLGGAEAGARLRGRPDAEVSFNYLGHFDQVLREDGLLALARESSGPNCNPLAPRGHLIEIGGAVAGGRLQMDWTYSENVHLRPTVERLAADFLEALKALIAHAGAARARAYTPSDFPLAGLTREQLGLLTEGGRQVEDIYPPSPLQEGMLFHTVYAPQSGVYIEQVSCTLGGDFDLPAFERAWERVMERHAILRTAFVWENLDRTLQVVERRVKLPVEQLDWRGLSQAERDERLEAYLLEDRRRGFAPSSAPLMRLAVALVDERTRCCVWSFHHLLLDGWCISMMLMEVFAFYEAFSRGRELRMEAVRPYRDYIAWLQGRPQGESERFWRGALKGFTSPTPLGGSRAARDAEAGVDEGAYGKRETRLSAEKTAALQAFARRHHLTVNTLVQGAWALVLSRHSGEADVLFGTVVSGRPVELPGVETIVGPFINTLPVRVRVTPEAGLLDWLRELQARQVEARQHEHSSLTQIQGWSEVPRGLPLFESLLTFENRPVGLAGQEQEMSVSVGDLRHVNRNNLPLTVVANPSATLALQASYDRRRFDDSVIERLLRNFEAALTNMLALPGARLDAVELQTEEEKRGAREAETKREAAKFNRFKNIKPKSVAVPTAALVRGEQFAPGQTLPLVLRPAVADIDAAGWARGSRDYIHAELRKHGAILFRDFQINSVADFEQFTQAIHPELFSNYGDLPREGKSEKVYKSTPYPPDKAILFHNESSHLRRWPLKQWFYCARAAESGGETPIVDCRKVYGLLDPAVVARFAEKKLMYVRNFTDGIDVSWQEFFKTPERAEVERICRDASMDFEWKENGLRVRQVCRAVARHPLTGEMVFFNQIQLHHVSCLDPDTRAHISALFKEEDFPRNVYYGDGSPIEDSLVAEIRDLYWRTSVSFPWREGDVLMLDNMLTAHARKPFVGERKIVVAMGEMIGQEDS